MNKIPAKRVKGLIGLWTVIIAVSAYEIHNNMVEQACNKEFHNALLERSEANDQAELFARQQRQAMADWVKDFSNPPPGSDFYGPERLDWLHEVSARALDRFVKLDQATEVTLAKRKPLTELTCGT